MISESVLCCSRVKPNKQRIVGGLISDCEITIFSVLNFIVPFLNFHSQLTGNLCQLMNLLVSKPKLTSDVTKAVFVLLLPPVESNKAIKALVKDCPSSPISLHVTEHLKTGFVYWVHCVNAILFEAHRKQFSTVSGCKKLNKCGFNTQKD